MVQFILWYLTIMLLGWLAFPLTYKMLRFLPDRGYTLAKPVGLLVWGFLFWLLASLHVLQNDIGGVIFAVLVLAILNGVLLTRPGTWPEMREWLKEKRGFILAGELVFLGFFVLMALMRAAYPDINGTEKPMELAFINAILRSPSFPPSDPWLSGYSISYYYFGYVIVAILTRVTGVETGIAFNLTSSMWFGLVAIGAYGLAYNLISLWSDHRKKNGKPGLSMAAWALLAPIFILIVSNFGGVLEMMHADGLFWTQDAQTGKLTSQFWTGLQIEELDQPPTQPFSLAPTRVSGWWWWRSSRILADYDFRGTRQEVIDEFPFFTYYLADIHPHVLSMPFVLLAIGLSLNLFIRGSREDFQRLGIGAWARSPEFWFIAMVFGGLSFLNTWDFPVYVGLFCLTYIFVRYQQAGWRPGRILEFLKVGISFGIAGILLYLPFYFGFSSQAGGILPSLRFFTPGKYYWIMFGTLLIPIAIWLIWLRVQRGSNFRWGNALKWSAGVIFGFWLLSFLFGFLAVNLPAIGTALLRPEGGFLSNLGQKFVDWGTLFMGKQGLDDPVLLILGSLGVRLTNPGTWITLLLLFALVWGLIRSYRFGKYETAPKEMVVSIEETSFPTPNPNQFVLLLVLMGTLLTLVPEFVYLLDQFGTRMNTIFKFYFQAWMMWGLAAAFATVIIWNELKGWIRVVVWPIWVIVFLCSMAYPIFGLSDRLQGPTNNWTLDGNAYLKNNSPDEWGAIEWLQNAPYGIVAEATIPNASYNAAFARMSTRSGLPTLLGWPGHESQWRGGEKEKGSRLTDLETLYRTGDWVTVQTILAQYHVRYIIVGSAERTTYRVNESKFQAHLKIVFQQGLDTIYEVPDLGIDLTVINKTP